MDYDAEFKRMKAFRDKFEPMLEHMHQHFEAHLRAESQPVHGESIVGDTTVTLPARVMMGDKGTVRSFDTEGTLIAEYSGPDALEKLRAAGYSGPIERPQAAGTETTTLSPTTHTGPMTGGVGVAGDPKETPPNKDGASSRSGGSHKRGAR